MLGAQGQEIARRGPTDTKCSLSRQSLCRSAKQATPSQLGFRPRRPRMFARVAHTSAKGLIGTLAASGGLPRRP